MSEVEFVSAEPQTFEVYPGEVLTIDTGFGVAHTVEGKPIPPRPERELDHRALQRRVLHGSRRRRRRIHDSWTRRGRREGHHGAH